MLTIVDKPLIQYAVNEAVEAGCEMLIFITGRSKRAIADYFDRSPELESELQSKGKLEALQAIQDIIPKHVKCVYVRQAEPLGLGHAVLCAADLIAPDEPFAVLLPDDLIDGAPKGALAQMVYAHHHLDQAAVIAIEEVPLSEVHKYGVIQPKHPDEHPMEIVGIVEKPTAEKAPSNWSVVGRYILTPAVMESLKTQNPGLGGEIQLTDAISRCLPQERIFGYSFNGKHFDCGSKRGFLEANLYFGLKQSQII